MSPCKYKHKKKKSLKKNKRGAITLYIVWIITAIIIITITAVAAPMGVQFNAEMYAAGEQILADANDSISKINNTAVKTELYAAVDDALDSTQDTIEINANLFKYAWIVVIFLSAIIVFLYTRTLTEYQNFGGGFV